jgi:hypothetical protein
LLKELYRFDRHAVVRARVVPLAAARPGPDRDARFAIQRVEAQRFLEAGVGGSPWRNVSAEALRAVLLDVPPVVTAAGKKPLGRAAVVIVREYPLSG